MYRPFSLIFRQKGRYTLIFFHNFLNLDTHKGGTGIFWGVVPPLYEFFCDPAEYCTALFGDTIFVLLISKNVPPFNLQFCTALYLQFKMKKYETSNYVPPSFVIIIIVPPFWTTSLLLVPPFLKYVFIHSFCTALLGVV